MSSAARSTRSTRVRDLLEVEGVHAIGYCVAGTTLAATLAVLAARGEAEKVASATFFTAQVDFAESGRPHALRRRRPVEADRQAWRGDGFLDGRYMAATFNLLRGRDLIWNYVTNNYLLGKDYAPFDLLHWNGDVTNLPADLASSYLTDLYRDNRLVYPRDHGAGGTPIDLARSDDADLCPGRSRGPYRAGRERLEDHPPLRGSAPLRARRLGAHRRRGQPAGGGQIPILDQRREGRRRSPSSSRARRKPRAAGGPTGSAGSSGKPPRGLSRKAHAFPARASLRPWRTRRELCSERANRSVPSRSSSRPFAMMTPLIIAIVRDDEWCAPVVEKAQGIFGRGERIRTSGPCLPKTVLCQAELLPDRTGRPSASVEARRGPVAAVAQAYKVGPRRVHEFNSINARRAVSSTEANFSRGAASRARAASAASILAPVAEGHDVDAAAREQRVEPPPPALPLSPAGRRRSARRLA